jgi:hypothetical protein
MISQPWLRDFAISWFSLWLGRRCGLPATAGFACLIRRDH